MLSAMRELILDGPLPAGDISLRRASLARRFPDLDRAEIDDLAAIPPERIHVYTRLIFNGERATLRWAFPMSLAAIRRMLGVADDAAAVNAADFELVRDVHRRRPWHSASHRALAANFQTYVLRHRPDLTTQWGGLVDLVDYERTDVDIFYANDVPHVQCDVERLAAMTVGDLMDVLVIRPSYAALRKFNVDVPALAARWRREQTLPIPLPPPQPTLVAAGRDPQTLQPSWISLTPPAHAALQQVPAGMTVRLNAAASAYLDTLPADTRRDEQRAFQQFFEQLCRWFSAGVLLRATE